MRESDLIKYWAGMLDESSGPDLSKIQGTMTQVINDQVMDKIDKCRTAQDVYDLVKGAFDANGIDTEASRRLLYHIQQCGSAIQAMTAVHNSRMDGMNLGVGGHRHRRTYESGMVDEVRHSMRGPAAARKDGGIDEIADMRQKLASGVVEFTFWKHGENGQGDVQRHAVGTTSEQVVPVAERRRLDPNYDENVASYERRAGFIIWFWDLEKNAVRCFNTNRFDEILNYEPTDRRAAPNVERVGNIFIHRDVDADANRPLDDARIDDINIRLDGMMQSDDDELVQALHGTADGLGVRGMYVDKAADGVPMLRIEISKHGADQDPPYQLRINELRSLIRDRFGVDVKTVTVDGTFRY